MRIAGVNLSLWLGLAHALAIHGQVLAADNPKSTAITYENGPHTSRETYSDGRVLFEGIMPKRLLPSQAGNPFVAETHDQTTFDCSTAEFRCLKAFPRVFAVPRERISPTAKYSTEGALFSVEDCLRGDASNCQVALISSECQRLSGANGCETVRGGRRKSDNPGPIIYFIFNEDVGVTAWGGVMQPAKTQEQRRAIASQMLLQGERGLLFSEN